MSLTIITNNYPRKLVSGYELTAKERADFDYIAPEDFDSHDFVRYRGRLYDISEFMAASGQWGRWDGYTNDSAFSGILIRMVDTDSAILGRYFS